VTDSELEMVLGTRATFWPGGVDPEGGLQRDAWLRVLAGLTLEECITAMEVLSRRGERFPPPVGLVAKTALDLRVDETVWAEVWAEILDHVHNAPDKVLIQGTIWPAERPWSVPLIGKLVELVGWETIGQCCDEDLRTLEAQCREKYKPLVSRAKEYEALAPLGGGSARIEAARARSGFVPLAESLRTGS
jgi:hypothetical protein